MTFSKVGGKKNTLSRWPRVSEVWAGGRVVFHIAGDKFQHISDVELLVTTDRKSRPLFWNQLIDKRLQTNRFR